MKEWTIMIYMAGDNNLAVDMAYALEQIKGVAEAPDSPNLFVYYDGNSPAIPTMYCDFSEAQNPRYVRSYKVQDKLYPVKPKYNENAADIRSIVNFVHWCVNQVPVESNGELSYGRRAKKYALIFSGHSLGFQDIGLFKDETSGKSMNMRDFYAALERITSSKKELKEEAKEHGFEGDILALETQPLLGQKLDILGFDSCVMGMLEVGYQFGPMAKTIIASEGSVPSAGWTYAKILGLLAGDTHDVDTRDLAALFVKKFVRSQDNYTVGGVSVDMAAWDMSRFGHLAAAFDALSLVLTDCFTTKDRIYRQMERVILKVHWECQSYMFEQSVDLGDFCEILDRECGYVLEELSEGDDLEILLHVQRACREVSKELRKTVILSGFSGGSYQYSNGISVFFPWSWEAYEVSRKNYESLWFAKEAEQKSLSWSGFLKKYLSQVSLRKCAPTDPGVPVGARVRYDSGVRFSEAFEPVFMDGNGNSMTRIVGQEGTRIAGQEGTRIAGQEGTRIAGQEGTRIAGQEGTRIAGQEGTRIAGQEGTRIAGQEGTRIAGQEGTRIAGQEGTRIAGQEGTRIAGQEGTRIAGQEGTRIAGQEGTRIAGQEGTRIAGQEGTRIAGQEGTRMAGQGRTRLAGGGSNAFFESLQLFKNVESRWDISGFTKKPEE